MSPNQTSTRAPSLESAPEWTLAERIGFRFLFVYVALMFVPKAVTPFPFARGLTALDQRARYAVVPWMATPVFRLPELTSRPNGSGDTTVNYVEVLCVLTMAALATLVWSLVDRRREGYATLAGLLRTFVRYFLAEVLLVYGSQKVVPV